MLNLQLQFEKKSLLQGETLQDFFEHLRGDYAFLLESGKGGDVGARYSYIGYDPFCLVWCENGEVQMRQLRDFMGDKKSGVDKMIQGEPLQILRELMGRFNFKGAGQVPFFGGAAGFFGYDFGADLMKVKQRVFDDLKMPDFYFGFYDKIIAFDHQAGEIYLCAVAETDLAAKRKIEQIKEDLMRPLRLSSKGTIGKLESNLSKKTYIQKVEKVKELLSAGETYQVNFSQRFSADCVSDSWTIYKKLAAIDPAPYACYFQYPDFAIVSASPELLVRKRGRNVETWPIKGTVKRAVARNSEGDSDVAQVAQLLASQKDQAELTMIVDLERNDLGKVCETGSVRVASSGVGNLQNFREIQKLSHVIHTFSRVQGKLSANKDIFDLVEAIFPGGSITGCPKKRTMEIIDQLEDFKRGIYTGSAGWIGFHGDSEFNILIRTMLLKDGRVYFQAGGGIVVDSDSEKEFEETLDKVEALREALG